MLGMGCPHTNFLVDVDSTSRFHSFGVRGRLTVIVLFKSMLSRKPDDTDMADAEREIYQEVFPEQVGIPNVCEAKYSVRENLNTIRYQERTGCQWRNLPHGSS